MVLFAFMAGALNAQDLYPFSDKGKYGYMQLSSLPSLFMKASHQ